MFHFPDPGVRYTRATPSLRRPTACQRSSGVIAELMTPRPGSAARAAGRRADALGRRTPSASASRVPGQRPLWEPPPHPPLDHPGGVLREQRLERREPVVPHVARGPGVALLLGLSPR